MHVNKKKLKRLRSKRGNILPYFSLVAVLIVTTGATLLFYQKAKQIDEIRFTADTLKVTAALEKMILAQSAAFVRTSQQLEPVDDDIDSLAQTRGHKSVGVFIVSTGSGARSEKGFTGLRGIVMPAEYDGIQTIAPSSLNAELIKSEVNTREKGVVYVRLEGPGSNAEGGLLFFRAEKDRLNQATSDAGTVRFLFTVVPDNELNAIVESAMSPMEIRTHLSPPGGSISIPANNPVEQTPTGGNSAVQKTIEASGIKINAGFAAMESFYADSQMRFTILIPVIGSLLGLLIFGLLRIEVNSKIAVSKIASALDDARTEKAALLLSEKEARRAAEESSRAKDEFMATISHEIRTPLNAISGWTKILEDSQLSEDRKTEALRTIKRNVNRQSEMINELLLFSSLKSKEAPLVTGMTRASDLVDEVAESVMPAVDLKRIRFSKVNRLSDEKIKCDRNKIAIALRNLMKNAIKFTPNGGEIHFLAKRQDDYIRILIRDSGKGIPKEFLPHIFDKFRQSDQTTTRQFGGLGLGLAISKQIIRLHGGIIDVRSKGKDSGAEFEVRIPVDSGAKT